ncbi:MAG: hypothetical protein MUF16_29070, partial [Burkholderiaceae bacterium]|nr:hypothetical protein [Burkholderiaceae bacterium]
MFDDLAEVDPAALAAKRATPAGLARVVMPNRNPVGVPVLGLPRNQMRGAADRAGTQSDARGAGESS